MNTYQMSEESYKNGYEAGVKELAERLKGCLLERDDDTIDSVARKLIDKQREDGKNDD